MVGYVPNLVGFRTTFIVNKSAVSPVVFSGDNVVLLCSARGYSQLVGRWYKDDTLV